MATKKNKQKAKKPFWEMDFLKHYLPTVVKARIARKDSFGVRMDSIFGITNSRLRKTLRAFRMLVNKNQILLSNRFGMLIASDDNYESDLVLLDFQKKQRLEVYYKKLFSMSMEDKDSLMSKTMDWNERTWEQHVKMMQNMLFPNHHDVKTGQVSLWTRTAQQRYSDVIGKNAAGKETREMDLRSGGYIPMDGPDKQGVATVKKATIDDVLAIVTSGEFVFQKEAVRAIGAGSNKRGALVLYAIMDQLYELNKTYPYTPDEINDEDETI